MSHGNESVRQPLRSGPLTARLRVRYLALAVGALLTWLCLESALALAYPDYPPGIQTSATTPLRIFFSTVLASSAIAIAIMIAGKFPSRYLILYLIASGLILTIATQMDFDFFGDETQTILRRGVGAVIAVFALVAAAATFASATSETLIENLRLKMPERRRVLAFAVPIAAWIALIVAWRFTPFNPVIHPDAPDPVANIHEAFGGYALLTLAYLAVLVPIGEEIIFRGLIVTYFGKAANLAIAVLASALVFALLHIDPNFFSFNQILFISSLGILLAATVVVTQSIWPGVVIHVMNNALVSLQSILL